MSEAAERRIAELEEQLAATRRELLGIQEMIYFILDEVGEPVVVGKEVLRLGAQKDRMVNIVENEDMGAFVFSVGEVNEDGQQ